FIVQLLRCNNSYIVHDAPAARLESERKSCAIWYILFCQSPKFQYHFGFRPFLEARQVIR
ncbi:MAG: hypothetical protein BECKG1743F_GA0114225_107951, partial [Candidatus Kentron sp. G]